MDIIQRFYRRAILWNIATVTLFILILFSFLSLSFAVVEDRFIELTGTIFICSLVSFLVVALKSKKIGKLVRDAEEEKYLTKESILACLSGRVNDDELEVLLQLLKKYGIGPYTYEELAGAARLVENLCDGIRGLLSLCKEWNSRTGGEVLVCSGVSSKDPSRPWSFSNNVKWLVIRHARERLR